MVLYLHGQVHYTTSTVRHVLCLDSRPSLGQTACIPFQHAPTLVDICDTRSSPRFYSPTQQSCLARNPHGPGTLVRQWSIDCLSRSWLTSEEARTRQPLAGPGSAEREREREGGERALGASSPPRPTSTPGPGLFSIQHPKTNRYARPSRGSSRRASWPPPGLSNWKRSALQ